MKAATKAQIVKVAEDFAGANPITQDTHFCVVVFGETRNGTPQYVICVTINRQQKTAGTISAAGTGSDKAVEKVFYNALCDAWVK